MSQAPGETLKFSADKINKFLEGPVVLKVNCYPTKKTSQYVNNFYNVNRNELQHSPVTVT